MKSSGKSPFVTDDEKHHAAAMAALGAEDVHEFYGPFAMVPDLVEVVRVVSPAYGAMDMVVLLEPRPVRVYVGSALGERYLRERYPEVERYRVPDGDLMLTSEDEGESLVAELHAEEGPLRSLSITVRAEDDALIEVERYESHNVWGSRFECHGIDLRQAARCRGIIEWRDQPPTSIDVDATIFRGSYGKISPAARAAARSTR